MAARRILSPHVLLALGAVSGVLLDVDFALAAPSPRLVVLRSDDAADCPDAVALASAVDKQMQRPALNPTTNEPDAPVYEVRIARSKEGYSATIQSGDLTRELSDPGSTCGELADALALTLAILLDNEPAPLPPATTVPSDSSLKPVSTPASASSTPPPPVVFRVKPARRWHVGVDLAVGETIGFLTPVSFAFVAGASFRYDRISIGAGMFGIPWATVDQNATAGVDLRLFTSLVHVCGRVAGKASGIHLSACGQTFLGAIHGVGRGFPVNRGGTQPWWALGAMGSLDGPLAARVGWFLRLSLAVPIVSYRFTATPNPSTESNPVTLFEPLPFAAFLSAGLRWTIL